MVNLVRDLTLESAIVNVIICKSLAVYSCCWESVCGNRTTSQQAVSPLTTKQYFLVSTQLPPPPRIPKVTQVIIIIYICSLSKTHQSKCNTLFRPIKSTNLISLNVLQRPDQFWNNCNNGSPPDL